MYPYNVRVNFCTRYKYSDKIQTYVMIAPFYDKRIGETKREKERPILTTTNVMSGMYRDIYT